MIKAETISFIKQRLQNGATEVDVKDGLLKSGYTNEEIETAIESAKEMIGKITPIFQDSKQGGVFSTIVSIFVWFFALGSILFSSWYIYNVYKGIEIKINILENIKSTMSDFQKKIYTPHTDIDNNFSTTTIKTGTSN